MGKAPAEMTVAVIKKELEARGLDTKGLKAVLVARLEEALAGDATGDAAPVAEPAAPEETPAEEPKPYVPHAPENVEKMRITNSGLFDLTVEDGARLTLA